MDAVQEAVINAVVESQFEVLKPYDCYGRELQEGQLVLIKPYIGSDDWDYYGIVISGGLTKVGEDHPAYHYGAWVRNPVTRQEKYIAAARLMGVNVKKWI